MVNHIEANKGKFNEGKCLKFPIASHPIGPYNHHIVVRVDTGADVNCMNENTFKELLPEVQHRQNATWEPATVVNQCAPNTYWIMQENGAKQPRVYRHTRTSFKKRSTPTDGEAKAQMEEYLPEKENAEFHIPAIPNGNRNLKVENSQQRSSSRGLALSLPT